MVLLCVVCQELKFENRMSSIQKATLLRWCQATFQPCAGMLSCMLGMPQTGFCTRLP